MTKSKFFAAAWAALTLIGGCASTGGAPDDARVEAAGGEPAEGGGVCLSPAYQPDPETLYRYGNFCGPAHPYREADPANAPLMRAIAPVDDIDRICKLHDLCYAEYGVDSFRCDQLPVIGDVFEGAGDAIGARRTGQVNRIACDNQYNEIHVGVSAFKLASDNDRTRASRMTSLALTSPLIGGTGGMRCMLVRMNGFPEPGTCHVRQAKRARVEARLAEMIADARALKDCGGSAEATGNFRMSPCFRDKSKLYRETVDLEAFLAGEAW